MSSVNKILHCSLLAFAVLVAMFVAGSICLPTELPVLQIDEGWSAPEVQDELKLKHVTSPSIQARKYSYQKCFLSELQLCHELLTYYVYFFLIQLNLSTLVI